MNELRNSPAIARRPSYRCVQSRLAPLYRDIKNNNTYYPLLVGAMYGGNVQHGSANGVNKHESHQTASVVKDVSGGEMPHSSF